MVIVHSRDNVKPTGGSFIKGRGKRLREKGNLPTLTKLGKIKKKFTKTIGGSKKTRLLQSNIINLLDPKTKKFSKAKIVSVIDNPANRHFVRRSIITKGTVVETEAGKARITSRPGQEGTVNAVLI